MKVFGWLLGVGAVMAATAASAADPVIYAAREKAPAPASATFRGYTGLLPACDDGRVLGRVAGLFATRERGYWASGLEIAAFDRPREIGYRSWGPEFIPRRFCAARTVTNDGRRRQAFYEIGEGFGFAGIGWDVNWCVTGLDRNRAHAPGCKMTRP
ncbi:hypothetical protein ACFQ4O_10095 [Methylopila musalis]|uniref:WG repeat-containing protein n=2 Tax=Methylopila musalis TaxID=1134781 RepID=A0ABW3Z7W0_9HYPH